VIIRRLGTSPTQPYRFRQMLRLLQVLDCDVDLAVRAKSA
jgi:hypothetical protein